MCAGGHAKTSGAASLLIPRPCAPRPPTPRLPPRFVLSNATTKYISTKWSYVPDGDVSATPAVFGGRVFFPTWRGSVVALNNATGAELW